jgi:hypothetical protein
MMPNRWLALLTMLWATSLAGAQTAAQSRIDVYDDFESSPLSSLWENSRLEPGSITFEKSTVRAGHQAIAITVRPQDKFEAGEHGNADSERDELLESRKLVSREGASYEFSFSMYFPKDFPIVPTRLVIAQWKQYCGDDKLPCEDDSPVLALRYVGGVLSVTQDLEHKKTELFAEKGEFRGRWLDFKVQAHFVPSETGHVKVWLGDRLLLDHHGVTANAENAATGYANPSRFYFKMGLYRNVMPEPMTVFVDEYRKRSLDDNQF